MNNREKHFLECLDFYKLSQSEIDKLMIDFKLLTNAFDIKYKNIRTCFINYNVILYNLFKSNNINIPVNVTLSPDKLSQHNEAYNNLIKIEFSH